MEFSVQKLKEGKWEECDVRKAKSRTKLMSELRTEGFITTNTEGTIKVTPKGE